MNGPLSIPVDRLAMLMPMHLLVDADGLILSSGPTLRKLIGRVRTIDAALELRRAPTASRLMPTLAEAARSGQRLFLGLRDSGLPPLRGEATLLPHDTVLINLGFGIGVIEAVSAFALTDADFAANELAIEMMYLHKSNQAIRAELARHSQQLEQAREAAEMQAFSDPLTGLLNRRGIELAFSLAIEARQSRDRRQEFAVLQVDLDWFKEVNDRHGHAAGDAVLRHVAQMLQQETRAEDSVARIGGDEFLVLLPDMSSETALHLIGRRIIAAIQQPVRHEDHYCRVSASIGGALSEQYDQISSERILSDADEALYAAKRAGRGCLKLFGQHG
ncbi:GGDEF domain-containing protein [Paracoccus sediminicola]|uniref:GGDEF domain-containing protein n=1 Tax=Paracoccus sediminicola TaxID=3017783 RepID=UPI0022F07430|nr:GGDEF domain-containing protein [Paracoccus sediminicola]WBU57518.1 GGDEF domain-containing protein [Paracoccus sediminicola]